MSSAKAMSPSIAASPPNRYGTGECHGEAATAVAAGGGGAAGEVVDDVDVGLETLVGAGLMASISSDRQRGEAVCGNWQFLASRERKRGIIAGLA